MAGSLVNTYAVGDVNLDNMMTVLDDTRRGFHQVSLTEMTTTVVPKIAAGSKIEVGGALYEFTSDETLGGAPGINSVYICIVPSGATCTAIMTTTPPTWSDAKQGWYGTGGSATYRYIHYVIEYVSLLDTYTKYLFPSNRTYSTAIPLNSFSALSISSPTIDGTAINGTAITGYGSGLKLKTPSYLHNTYTPANLYTAVVSIISTNAGTPYACRGAMSIAVGTVYTVSRVICSATSGGTVTFNVCSSTGIGTLAMAATSTSSGTYDVSISF